MIISHKKKLIFVHIQKTGGNTITSLLQKTFPDSESFLNKHDLAVWGKENMAEEWNEYYKFALVRNPWDRLVSWYSMIEKNKGKYRNKLWDYVIKNSSSFEEFIYKCTDVVDDSDGKKCFAFNQMDYLSDENETMLVDFVGKYELLEEDLNRLFDNLGINQIEIPWLNSSDHKHYSQYYSNETKEIVEARFAKDIAAFNYKFEEM
jgi:chondroitin 4-sulfotransferase 11